jgi:hypothetical protein
MSNKEEHMWKVFEKGVPRIAYGSEREEISAACFTHPIRISSVILIIFGGVHMEKPRKA